MTAAAKKLIEAAQSLTVDERLEIASELLAGADGPPDPDWDGSWKEQLERREEAAKKSGGEPAEWASARTRIAERLLGLR